jgi:hypothetical protein
MPFCAGDGEVDVPLQVMELEKERREILPL